MNLYQQKLQQFYRVQAYHKQAIGLVKNEFFQFSKEKLGDFFAFYRNLYGQGAYQYFKKALEKWKEGEVRMSTETERRILACVTKFLPDTQKFELLKLEMLDFSQHLRQKYFLQSQIYYWQEKNKIKDGKGLNQIYMSYQADIEGFNKYSLKWFAQGVFQENDIEDLVALSKFILQTQLWYSYHHVQKDLKYLFPKIQQLKRGYRKINYLVDFMGLNLNLINFKPAEVCEIERAIFPDLRGDLKQYTEEYLLKELLFLDNNQQQNIGNSQLQAHSFDLLLSQYRQVMKARKDASFHSILQGEGGLMEISLELRSLPSLYLSALGNFAKIILELAATLFFLFGVGFAMGNPFMLLIWILIVGSTTLSWFWSDLKDFKNNVKDIIKYR